MVIMVFKIGTILLALSSTLHYLPLSHTAAALPLPPPKILCVRKKTKKQKNTGPRNSDAHWNLWRGKAGGNSQSPFCFVVARECGVTAPRHPDVDIVVDVFFSFLFLLEPVGEFS